MVGFMLGSIGEAEITLEGIGYGVLSSVFIALYGVCVKRFSRVVDDDTWYGE